MLFLEGDLCKQSNLFSVHCHFNACSAMSCDIISADSKKVIISGLYVNPCHRVLKSLPPDW